MSDQKPRKHEAKTTTPGLVGAEALLKELWPNEADRPSLRWLRGLQAKRVIPFRKIGHKVYFDAVEVRRALDTQFTVKTVTQ